MEFWLQGYCKKVFKWCVSCIFSEKIA